MTSLAEELNERSKRDDEMIVGSEIRAALQEQRLKIERLEKVFAGMTELKQATTEQRDTAQRKVVALTTEVRDLKKRLEHWEGAALQSHRDSVSGNPSPECEWFEDDDGWHSGCGKNWEFTYDGPKENGLDFCMNCGRPVTIAEFADGSQK